MGFGGISTGTHIFVVVFSSYFTMLVVLVVSEIRKSIACLIVLRTKQCSNWFLFEPFKCDMTFFSTCDLQLWKRTLYHLSYCDQSTRGN